MTCARGVIEKEYTFQVYDERIDKTISFRKATLERDLGRLHRWLNEPHVKPYWERDYPLPKFRKYLEDTLVDDHHTPYIGYLDHVPMSYWEAYWSVDDKLSAEYDARAADRGIHLLIGPPEFLGHGYATPLLEAMTRLQFQHSETNRIVSEPDIRNKRVHRVFENCGFKPDREIELESKDALLMICNRERFETEILSHRRTNNE
ncbi:GNAT family N-acetyltransferase [Haloarchaeobius amylolyticus]|uniref:GNAT family N-acetyltransferase n=1 Tax=Haloarchaeobius amylolyticus TaxID=1198296 RepID=A0ABD6BHN3_9EURY